MDESMEEWGVVVLYQGSETFSIEGAICAHSSHQIKTVLRHKTYLVT